MIQNITNNIILDLREVDNLTPQTIMREYPKTSPKFPCVIVEEGNIPVVRETRDSGGFHHTDYSVNIEIFTTGDGKINEMTKLRNQIDNIISGEYGLERTLSQPIPNMGDVSVYRYRLTYVGRIDKNKVVYRR